MANKGRRLTERQKRFADHYITLGNARQAAVKAGFSAGYAAAAIKKPKVIEYLGARLELQDNARIADGDEVMEYYTRLFRGEEQGEASRMKAAEMLAKRLGLLTEGAAAKPERAVIIDDIADCPETVNED